VAVAKLVFAGEMAIHLAWPQLALQPWMVSNTTGLAAKPISRGIRDLDLPRACT
jgi:hypothetical protein